MCWRGAPFRIHVQRRRQAAAAAPLLTVVERTRGDQPVPPACWFPLRQFTAGKTVDFPELLSQSRLSKASCFILRDNAMDDELIYIPNDNKKNY